MATITKRKVKGGYSYTAQIRRKGYPTKARTFPKRAMAEAWAERVEEELSAGIVHLPLRKCIERYLEEFGAQYGRSKLADLDRLKRSAIAEKDAAQLTTADIVEHVKERRKVCAPSTAMNDIVWIGVVLRTARSVFEWPVEPRIATEAREACRKLRIASKSNRRDRLPLYSELQALDDYFSRQDARAQIPMRPIMWFAIYSGRRQAEICRLDPSDDQGMTGLVRDLKHPEGAKGNHRRFRYTEKGLAVWQKYGPFPYKSESVSAAFTRACKVLGIEDLRFHDLRREATTRLFESGLTIPEVATYTLHESWNELKRYTNLLEERDIYDPEGFI